METRSHCPSYEIGRYRKKVALNDFTSVACTVSIESKIPALRGLNHVNQDSVGDLLGRVMSRHIEQCCSDAVAKYNTKSALVPSSLYLEAHAVEQW